MTRVFFIRHGEAEGNIDRIFHGHYNSNLTENGKEQVSLVAKRLANEPFDAIYSSDLNRAYETAKAIAKGRNIEIIKDTRLREVYGGKWEGVPWEQLPLLFPDSFGHWVNDPSKLSMPEGETMVEFQNRILNVVCEIVSNNAKKVICIATHGTAIKVLLCKYYGNELSDMPDMKWHDNASVTVVDFDDNCNSIVRIEGDNAHLGELSTLAKQSWWRKDPAKNEE
ncbi:MAG: histidine phosphatase family protein [Firmicutes bacterium]|nr:histidine phosphatase family protein [Bacillota bacterium]